MVQTPPVAVAAPKTVDPSKSVTVAPASPVPANVGVTMLVLLSVLEAPVSLAGVRSGFETNGGVVSIVTTSAAEIALTFPAASVARAVMVCVPLASVLAVIDQLPAPSAAAVPNVWPPSSKVTVAPASVNPLNTGVEMRVTLSESDSPLSLAGDKSGAEIVGFVASIVTTSVDELA